MGSVNKIIDQMGTIGSRIREERARSGLNQEEFARLASQSRKSQARYESDERAPDTNYLAALDKVGVDVMYVVTGRRADHLGSPAKNGRSFEATFVQPNASKPLQGDVELHSTEYHIIRRFDVNASAGPGAICSDDQSLDSVLVTANWLNHLGVAADMTGLISVKGDSMAPTIPDGCKLLVSFSEREITRDGDIFVLILDEEVFVKRLSRFEMEGGRGYVMSSDNPSYSPKFVSAQSHNGFRVIGRARAIIGEV